MDIGGDMICTQNNLLHGEVHEIKRTCDLVMFEFIFPGKDSVCLHIQRSFRVLDGDKLLISYDDMYEPSEKFKKKKFQYDIPGDTLFDDAVKQHRQKLLGAKVSKVYCSGKDLFLELDNNIRIEVLEDTVQTGVELYRIFEDNDEFRHFIVET